MIMNIVNSRRHESMLMTYRPSIKAGAGMVKAYHHQKWCKREASHEDNKDTAHELRAMATKDFTAHYFATAGFAEPLLGARHSWWKGGRWAVLVLTQLAFCRHLDSMSGHHDEMPFLSMAAWAMTTAGPILMPWRNRASPSAQHIIKWKTKIEMKQICHIGYSATKWCHTPRHYSLETGTLSNGHQHLIVAWLAVRKPA